MFVIKFSGIFTHSRPAAISSFSRRLPSDGHCKRHRVFLYVRAPFVALLRQGTRGIHTERHRYGAEQNSPRGRHFRTPPATARTTDKPDKRLYTRDIEPYGCNGGNRGSTPMYADARRAEATLYHHHIGFHWDIQGTENPRRIHKPHKQINDNKTTIII